MLYENGIFLFHRDLRIQDNLGLIKAHQICKKVYPCFITNPIQVGDKNPYRSLHAIQFMMDSLVELEADIRERGGELAIFYGEQTPVLKKLLLKNKIDCIITNRDYTPFSISRERETKELCISMKIDYIETEDYYLYPPGTILTGSGTGYKKFTPFYQKALNIHVNKPNSFSQFRFGKGGNWNGIENYISAKIYKKVLPRPESNIQIGGRREGEKIWGKFNGREENTFLSPYIKFGCFSIREIYEKFSKLKPRELSISFVRKLIWRDFFAHVLYLYPEVITNKHGYYISKSHPLKWKNIPSHFERWKMGQTGVPIVDASMRQLFHTGYIHNRCRMIVAYYLVKTLFIDWKKGEQHFARYLVDYDVASNNGNWQEISGTGVDMSPYYMNMNPYIQSKKFDKDASFIKKWVPELEMVSPNDIHRWNERYTEYHRNGVKYPKPI
jgi:deoxyribodipyrimidine photo-lyase